MPAPLKNLKRKASSVGKNAFGAAAGKATRIVNRSASKANRAIDKWDGGKSVPVSAPAPIAAPIITPMPRTGMPKRNAKQTWKAVGTGVAVGGGAGGLIMATPAPARVMRSAVMRPFSNVSQAVRNTTSRAIAPIERTAQMIMWKRAFISAGV